MGRYDVKNKEKAPLVAKKQMNYPRTLTNMYGLMLVFERMGATQVARGHNGGLDFRNMVANSEGIGGKYHGSGGGIGRKLECWNCGGENLKRNRPKRA